MGLAREAETSKDVSVEVIVVPREGTNDEMIPPVSVTVLLWMEVAVK